MSQTSESLEPFIISEGVFSIPDASLRAEISTRTPLLFDETTYEPYLPLPAPFQNFKLTPNRESDKDEVFELMNDPKVVYWMDNHPFPFPVELGQKWIKQELELTKEIFSAFAKGEWRPAKGSPLKAIRENITVASNDSDETRTEGRNKDVWVGDADLRHAHWWPERMTPVKDHWEEWRDTEKVWSIGAALKPSYHNRGIGSVAMTALFYQWGIPQIGCTEVRAGCYISNVGSNRIWEKLGFVESGMPQGTVVVQKEKTGGEERVEKDHILIWSLP